MSIDDVIARERALLDRLESFARRPEYARLLDVATQHVGAEAEPWLAGWLIRPAFGLGRCPIDIADEPGGIDLVADHLVRIAHDVA